MLRFGRERNDKAKGNMKTDHAQDVIEKSALQLSAASRARLAHQLIASLDCLSKDEIKALWLDEAIRRDQALDKGSIAAIPGDQVLAAIKAKYAR